MSSNAPDFDPLDCTAEEENDMLRGYMAAGRVIDPPAMMTVAFEHGWRMRRNDMRRVSDEDQRILASRYLDAQRRAHFSGSARMR